MSTTSKTQTLIDSASSNTDNETTIEKQIDKKEEELKKIKGQKFQELSNWLNKWGFEQIDTTKDNKIEGIEFQLQITPQLPYSTGESTPLYLEFQQDLDDGFILRTTFEFLEKKDTQTNEINFDSGYNQLENLIYPMNVSMIKSYPLINIYKVIFYDVLTKQVFLDSVNGLIHAMSLIVNKMNEIPPSIAQKT